MNALVGYQSPTPLGPWDPPCDPTTFPSVNPLHDPLDPSHPYFWHPAYLCQRLSIRAKSGDTIPCSFNPRHTHLYYLSRALWRAVQRSRWLAFVKPRQMGSSTLFGIYLMALVALQRGQVGAILAHKKDTAKSLARILDRAYKSLPDDLRPRKTAARTTHLYPDIDSMFTIAAAKDDEPLRGDTIQSLLITEVSSMVEESSSAAFVAARNAVPSEHGLIIAESTAMREGDPHQLLWQEAESPDSKWDRIFIPWTAIPEYAIDDIPRGWSPVDAVLEYRETHTISDAQAYWLQIEGLSKCQGRLDKFMAEYPTDDMECWTATGKTMFDKALLMRRLRELLASQDPTRTNLEANKLHVWEAPDPRDIYVICLDPAGSWSQRYYWGLEVFSLVRRVQVAEFRGYLKAREAAALAVDLSTRYTSRSRARYIPPGPAQVVVERNGIGEAVLSHLEVQGWDRHTWRPRGAHAPGWYSDRVSKPRAIGYLEDLIPHLEIQSEVLLRQLLKYQGDWTDRDDERKHFDLVIPTAMFADVWFESMSQSSRITVPRDYTDHDAIEAFHRQIGRLQAPPEKSSLPVGRYGPHR